ncbi:MAG: hypothetical protein Q8L48_00070 [Archangium sp.]|nr:hypothetical protein [Archangium sp.]
MRVSSLLGLSVGWLISTLGFAFDVGTHDVIFYPTLLLGLPAVLGLVVSVRRYRAVAPVEPFSLGRFLGFGVLGVVIVTLAVLVVISIFYWGEPLPPG